jgi:hypothetical protein
VQGGEAAIAEALAAQEIATISLRGGLRVCGVLTERQGKVASERLLVSGGARAELGALCARGDEVQVVLGDSRAALSQLNSGPVDLSLAHGVRLQGVLERWQLGAHGSALLVLRGGRLVALAEAAEGAHAGAPSDFFPPTELPSTQVPKSRSMPPREGAMLGLYETALSALRSELGSDVLPVFERLHHELERGFPNDWLLRWNLLESLQKLGIEGPLADALRAELTKLEVYYEYRQPIASGLRYLASVLGR